MAIPLYPENALPDAYKKKEFYSTSKPFLAQRFVDVLLRDTITANLTGSECPELFWRKARNQLGANEHEDQEDDDQGENEQQDDIVDAPLPPSVKAACSTIEEVSKKKVTAKPKRDLEIADDDDEDDEDPYYAASRAAAQRSASEKRRTVSK
jgi:hypothetical protein